MQYISWEEGFNIGIEEVDQQHRQLVRLINELSAAILRNAPQYVYKSILNQLVDYTDYHFSAEEKYINALIKKDKRLHLLQHQNFINELMMINQGAFDRQAAEQVWFFLSDWLITHIVSEDIKLSVTS